MAFEQLPLALQLADSATFDTFYVAEANRLLCNQLQHLARGDGEQWVYIAGAEGSGRSHLLQACCHAADRAQRQSCYLPVDELLAYDPAALLDGVETLDLVCLDNIDHVFGRPAWEQALFNSYNRMLASGAALLMSASRAPAQLACQLPDLRSRLTGFSVYQLHSLSDEERLSALQFRGRCLGLDVPREVAEYLYARCRRDVGELFATLDRLDRQSLALQRRLTVPFVRTVLGW